MARSALEAGRDNVELELGSEAWTIDYLLLVLLVATIVVTVVLNPNPVLSFIVAGIIAVTIYRADWIRDNRRQVGLWTGIGAIASIVYLIRDRLHSILGPRLRTAIESSPIWGLLVALWSNTWVKLFLFMIYTGSFIYGGGLVLIPFIEKYVVNEFAWMTGREFVDGVAIGQLSPGPVVMTTAFVGYKLLLDVTGGIIWIAVIGALVATVGAFGPSFVFILGFFPHFARVRDNEIVQTALMGVNAAVVGAILGATVTLARDSFVDPLTMVLGIVTFVLFHRGIDAVYLIIGGGAIGIGAFLLP